VLGYFAPGTHRVAPADACEALSNATRALLPAIRDAMDRSRAEVSEVAILEDLAGSRRLIRATASGGHAETARLGVLLAVSFDGVRVLDGEGRTRLERGDRSLSLSAGDRPFSVSVDPFFQANRHLLSTLSGDVAAEAGAHGAGEALDAFAGVGFFAGALLSAGHGVTSIESDAGAAADARRTRELWADRDRWDIGAAPISEFLQADDRKFTCVVADPPRAGLGVDLAAALAGRARALFVYVSCDPATLARDLPAILSEGFKIRRARRYALFAFTHRVEAMVALERVA
jgi:tRNA/tmRNA/rRNA uracil-C5-methylase (TrmA/RlmC/RlmD family)